MTRRALLRRGAICLLLATWVFLTQQVDIYATRDRVTWTPRGDQWMLLHEATLQ